MRYVTVLGSTGSIGTSTLDVLRRNRDEFGVFALVAGCNLDLLLSQVIEFKPKAVVVATEDLRCQFTKLLKGAGGPLPELLAGAEGRVEVATAPEVDFVMSAIVGIAGL